MNRQRVGRAFDDLVSVGVIERISGRMLIGQILAPQHFRSSHEVFNSSGALALLERRGYRNLAIDFDARAPEFVMHVDGSKRNGLDRIIALQIGWMRRCLGLNGREGEQRRERRSHEVYSFHLHFNSKIEWPHPAGSTAD